MWNPGCAARPRRIHGSAHGWTRIYSGDFMSESYEAQLSGIVFWRLDSKGPKEIALKAFPGWSLVAPLADGVLDYPKDSSLLIGRMPDDSVLLGTRVLRLKGPAQQQDEEMPKLHQAFPVVGQVL